MDKNDDAFGTGFVIGAIVGTLALMFIVWMFTPWSMTIGNATFFPRWDKNVYNRCVVSGNDYPTYEKNLIWCSQQFRVVTE